MIVDPTGTGPAARDRHAAGHRGRARRHALLRRPRSRRHLPGPRHPDRTARSGACASTPSATRSRPRACARTSRSRTASRCCPGNLEPRPSGRPTPAASGAPSSTRPNRSSRARTSNTLQTRWSFPTNAIVTGSPTVAAIELPARGRRRSLFFLSWDRNVYARAAARTAASSGASRPRSSPARPSRPPRR